MAFAAATGNRLLERESVLCRLGDSLDRARAGRGGLVLVAGEAGVGKSAAVAEFCEEARSSEQVLSGGCDARFTPRPLGPFLDVAEEAGGELPAAVESGPPEVVDALSRRLVLARRRSSWWRTSIGLTRPASTPNEAQP